MEELLSFRYRLETVKAGDRGFWEIVVQKTMRQQVGWGVDKKWATRIAASLGFNFQAGQQLADDSPSRPVYEVAVKDVDVLGVKFELEEEAAKVVKTLNETLDSRVRYWKALATK